MARVHVCSTVVSLIRLGLGGLVHGRHIASANTRKLPRRRGEYLYGVAPCLAALQTGRRQVYNIFLKTAVGSKTSELKSTALTEIKRYAEHKRMEIHYVNKEILERMSAKRPHQGIVLDVSPIKCSKLDTSACNHRPTNGSGEKPPVWLALDAIQDPMNFGAILRCAFFLGAEKVITTAKHCCSLSPVVSKASSGAMEMMPVYSLTDMPGFLSVAQSQGWEVIGTCSPEAVDKQSAVPVQDVSHYTLSQPTILVLGNEGYGVRKELSRSCTSLLTIPPLRGLPPGFDSLNVGVAAGIILHRLQTSFINTTDSLSQSILTTDR